MKSADLLIAEETTYYQGVYSDANKCIVLLVLQGHYKHNYIYYMTLDHGDE